MSLRLCCTGHVVSLQLVDGQTAGVAVDNRPRANTLRWAHAHTEGRRICQARVWSLTFVLQLQPLTHTRLSAVCPGLPGWAGTRKVKPIWILLKQETVSGSSISWAICKSAPWCIQITMPAPHYSVFTGQMPFLLPNQQRQSTEGTNNYSLWPRIRIVYSVWQQRMLDLHNYSKIQIRQYKH